MNQIQWPSNPYSHERASDLQEERIEKGLFRCDRCDLLKPLPVTLQDGHKLCRRCTDVLSPQEAQMSMAEDRARAADDPHLTLPYPVSGAFAGAPVITDISPLSRNVTRGGATVTFAITGVNLTTADTWSSSSSTHITVTPVVNSSTSVTLTVGADGTTTRANYNLTFNGDTLTPRGILKVR